MGLTEYGLWPRKLNEVDRARIEKLLSTQPLDVQLAADLFEFGSFRFDEARGRNSAIDSKVTSLLGWTGASLAFLTQLSPANISKTDAIAAGLLLAALIMAFFAVAFRSGWQVPSERDWLAESLISAGKQKELKQSYILSLFDASRSSNRIVEDKSYLANWSQLLAVAGWALLGLRFFQLF